MTQECPLKSYYVCKVLYNVRTISSYLVKEFMQTALNEEIVAFSKSINDVLTKASSLITTDAALTNVQGTINFNKGVKNEFHHNFEGTY